jgi:hypothetical protein
MRLGCLASRVLVVLGLGLGYPRAVAASFVAESDVPTGIFGEDEWFVSLRYMRHLWIAPDGMQVAVVQQGEDGGLGVYASADDGHSWSWSEDLPSSAQMVSDGTMLADGSVLVVTSIIGTVPIVDVELLRLDYDASSQRWSLDPASPTTVYDSDAMLKGTRGTIAVDSNGVLWSAFRLQNTGSGEVTLRLFSSTDDGASWQDSANVFGTANTWAEKNARVIATGTSIAVVYQDVQGPARTPVRSKGWALRDDAAPLADPMVGELIADMGTTVGDPFGSHWSVATDSQGNLHMSYQDDRIRYARFDAATATWSRPMALGTGSGVYNTITVTADDDLYLFTRFLGNGNLWALTHRAATQEWSDWIQVTAGPQPGFLRMCTPERVDDLLPVLYEVNASAPFELMSAQLDV